MSESFRETYRKQEIGARYSGWAHFSFTTIGSLAAIGFAISQLSHVSWELLLIPPFFLFANLGEYYGHRHPMHHSTRGMRILHKRHTLQHHQFFTHEDMAADSPRDFKMVLFPPVMLFFFLGVLAGPPAALLYFLVSPNVGLIFMAVGVGYFLTYEWLHFSYHLPADSWLGRRWLVRKLRNHHALHHDKSMMGRWNFNITFPICDLIFGTYYRPTNER